jgi:hypothetical protein
MKFALSQPGRVRTHVDLHCCSIPPLEFHVILSLVSVDAVQRFTGGGK